MKQSNKTDTTASNKEEILPAGPKLEGQNNSVRPPNPFQKTRFFNIKRVEFQGSRHRG